MVIMTYLHKYWKIQNECNIFKDRSIRTHEETIRTLVPHFKKKKNQTFPHFG